MQNVSRRSALGLVAGACVAPSIALAQGMPSITIAGVPEDSITPALWAEQRGLFKKHGVNVSVQAQRSGAAIAAGVAGGAYAIAKSSLPALIEGHAKGLPFRIVAPAGLFNVSAPTTGLIVKADSPIRSAADLNGKTVAVSSLNDLYTLSLKAWVDAHGGNSASLQLVEIPVSAVAAAVASGRVAAAGTTDPQMQEAVAAGGVRILSHPFEAIAPHFAYAAWFTTAGYAQKNPRVVDGFRDALREASAYCNAHHDATVAMLAAFTGLPVAKVSTMQRATYGTENDPKLYQPVIDAAAKYKMIPAPFDAKDLLL